MPSTFAVGPSTWSPASTKISDLTGRPVARVAVGVGNPDLGELIAYQLRSRGYEVSLESEDVPADLWVREGLAIAGGQPPLELRAGRDEEGRPAVCLVLEPPFTPGRIVGKTRELVRTVFPFLDPEGDILLQHGEILVDLVRLETHVADQRILLTRTEFDYLRLLITAAGTVCSRRQLLESCHRTSSGNERTVDVVVRGLRKKLGTQGHQIQTVRGRGYCLSPALMPGAPTG